MEACDSMGMNRKFNCSREALANIVCDKDILIHGFEICGSMTQGTLNVTIIDQDQCGRVLHEVSAHVVAMTEIKTDRSHVSFKEPFNVKGHIIKITISPPSVCRIQEYGALV